MLLEPCVITCNPVGLSDFLSTLSKRLCSAMAFIFLNTVQSAWISSKRLPSASYLDSAGIQGRSILLINLIITSSPGIPSSLLQFYCSCSSFPEHFLVLFYTFLLLNYTNNSYRCQIYMHDNVTTVS